MLWLTRSNSGHSGDKEGLGALEWQFLSYYFTPTILSSQLVLFERRAGLTPLFLSEYFNLKSVVVLNTFSLTEFTSPV